MRHKLPKPDAVANEVSFSIQADLGQFAMEFFEFYGNTYDCNTHIISLHVGRWQQKVQKGQTHFTPEQRK